MPVTAEGVAEKCGRGLPVSCDLEEESGAVDVSRVGWSSAPLP